MAGWRDLLGTTSNFFGVGKSKSTLDASAISAARAHVLPNASGTFALTQNPGDMTVNGVTVGRGTGAIASNTAVGSNVLFNNTSGANNVAVGVDSLRFNLGGYDNAAIGVNALRFNTSGFQNTALGIGSLYNNLGGSENLAAGSASLLANTDGVQNVALGSGAIATNVSGNSNTGIGAGALSSSTGSNNTGVGSNALSLTTASNNTALGVNAGNDLVSGGGNVVIGKGVLAGGAAITNNIVIGIGTGVVKARYNLGGWSLVGPLTVTDTDGGAGFADFKGKILTATESVNLSPTTVAGLPGVSPSGRHAFVTNALAPTGGSTVVGGGAVKTTVVSDGTNWLVVGVAGAAAPAAGSDTEVQYNNAGTTAGSPNLTFDAAFATLRLLSGNARFGIKATTAAVPSEPNTSDGTFFVRDSGNRMLPGFRGNSGIGYPLQSHGGFACVSEILPGGGTTITTIGCTLTSVGTVSNPTITATTAKLSSRRFAITSGTTAGSLASTRVSNLEVHGGQSTADGFVIGGWYLVARFSLDTLASGMRAFIGLTDTATTAPTNVDPLASTTPGKVGMAINASTGNWSLVNNITGTAPTVLALGADFPVNTTTLYELVLYRIPGNTSGLYYRITNLTTYTGPLTGFLSASNLPAMTTFLGRTAWATNNATAAAVAFSMNRFYLESDY